jgi:hypothetical protein
MAAVSFILFFVNCTNFTVQSIPWKGDNYWSGQEIPYLRRTQRLVTRL